MATLVATWDLSIDKNITNDTKIYTEIKDAAERAQAAWDTSVTSTVIGFGDAQSLIQGAENILAILRAGEQKPGISVKVVHITLYPN